MKSVTLAALTQFTWWSCATSHFSLLLSFLYILDKPENQALASDLKMIAVIILSRHPMSSEYKIKHGNLHKYSEHSGGATQRHSHQFSSCSLRERGVSEREKRIFNLQWCVYARWFSHYGSFWVNHRTTHGTRTLITIRKEEKKTIFTLAPFCPSLCLLHTRW